MENRRQMAQSLRTGVLLAAVGGFLESYTYLARGGVFANCQTGNLVLLVLSLAQGNMAAVWKYLVPVAAFFVGSLLALELRRRGDSLFLHWRQGLLCAEAVCLAGVALLPQGSGDMAATTLVSFVCALQASGFRVLHGKTYASTMCTGNLRSLADCTHRLLHGGSSEDRRSALRYAAIVLCFMGGAVLGAALSWWLGRLAVLFSCVLLALAFVAMAAGTVSRPPAAARPE